MNTTQTQLHERLKARLLNIYYDVDFLIMIIKKYNMVLCGDILIEIATNECKVCYRDMRYIVLFVFGSEHIKAIQQEFKDYGYVKCYNYIMDKFFPNTHTTDYFMNGPDKPSSANTIINLTSISNSNSNLLEPDDIKKYIYSLEPDIFCNYFDGTNLHFKKFDKILNNKCLYTQFNMPLHRDILMDNICKYNNMGFKIKYNIHSILFDILVIKCANPKPIEKQTNSTNICICFTSNGRTAAQLLLDNLPNNLEHLIVDRIYNNMKLYNLPPSLKTIQIFEKNIYRWDSGYGGCDIRLPFGCELIN